MRVIKFRAWHKERAAMYRVAGSLIDVIMLHVGDDALETVGFSDSELMQFTGLVDKTGREIYEGDIVKRYTSHIFVVKWNTDFCGFQPFCEYRNDYGLPDAAESSSLTEVLGNIYEHPHLLETR